jgi:ketosteroid isomerase-like protein
MELSVETVVWHYQEAVNARDPSQLRELLALDDARFTEIEDHIPEPFGAETAHEILRWIEEHPEGDYRVQYRDVKAFLLADTVAYVVAMHDWTTAKGTGQGRTTFIVIKEGSDWRIIHGHWSSVPSDS